MLCIFLFQFVRGQDIHFTQFYATPLYLNPAFSGANVCGRVSMAYRNQWPGISKTYRSFLFSADHTIQRYNMGIGLVIGHDAAGTGNLSTTIINPIVAYGIRVNRTMALRVAFQPGIGLKSINFDNLVFGDQLARGGNVPTIETPTENRAYFDMGTGALLYSKTFWVGTSFFHLTNSNESLFKNGSATLPLKYSFHGGLKFPLNKDETDDFQVKSLSPAFHYRGQQDFDQFDVGLYYTQYIINVGLWYRGIPVVKRYAPGYANNDAVAIIVGIQTDRLNIGYSFDLTISRLHRLSHGAHEVVLAYQFCELRKRKPKYGLMLPCPKF